MSWWSEFVERSAHSFWSSTQVRRIAASVSTERPETLSMLRQPPSYAENLPLEAESQAQACEPFQARTPRAPPHRKKFQHPQLIPVTGLVTRALATNITYEHHKVLAQSVEPAWTHFQIYMSLPINRLDLMVQTAVQTFPIFRCWWRQIILTSQVLTFLNIWWDINKIKW